MSDLIVAGTQPAQVWAGRIAGAWQKSLDAVFETGRLIALAKAELPHGAFSAMIESDLPFGARYAQMLMKVAEHPELTNPKHASFLPSSPATLYELTKLDPETLNRRFAEGAIRPDMARRDVAVNGHRAIMSSREQGVDSLDFFPTPPWATRALVEVVLPHLGLAPNDLGTVWEPACGEGHMTGVFAEYLSPARLVGTDIHHYGKSGRDAPGWRRTFDFLASDPLALMGLRPDWIVTNPPFGDLTLPFALRALELAERGVALFVRQQWLEGVERYDSLFADRPPTLYAQFAERVNLCEGRWEPFGSTATAYCWLVWVRDHAPQPTFWIPPGQRKRFHYADDVDRFTAHPVLPPASAAPDANWEEKPSVPVAHDHPEISGSVSESELLEWKALSAISLGVTVSGPLIDELRAQGLIWPDDLILTPAGQQRGQYLHERVKAAKSTDNPGAVRIGTRDAGVPSQDDYRAAIAKLADRTGRLVMAEAATALRLGRDAGVPPQRLAEDLGHPVGTIKAWLNRLGLTDIERMHAINAERAAEWSGKGGAA